MASSSSSSSRPPVSVIFVCLGNICRSPLAEAVFRARTAALPQMGAVDSAATAGYHPGESPDERTLAVLEEHGITGYGHAARTIRPDDFVAFDYVLAMDRQNLRDLLRVRDRVAAAAGGRPVAKTMLFGDFGGTKGEQVADPYYGGRGGFERAYEQMVRFTDGFVQEVLGEGVGGNVGGGSASGKG
jgi:low molecular weight phosphotyrosine protein phosphatase